LIELSTIKKCLKGNQAAYKQAYTDSLPYVLAVVKRYIFDESARPDAVQEVFIKLFNNLKNYDAKRGTVKTYVRTITVNCCISILRKNSSKPIINTLSVVEENQLGDESAEALVSLSNEDIMLLLNDMPTGYKVIFMLFAMEGYSHKEIAKQLDITSETSRSQYFRAKKWILNKLNNTSSIKSYGIF